MKTIKKVGVIILSALLLFSLTMAFACSNGDVVNIELKTPIYQYNVGDNVDLSDFHIINSGVTYTYKIAKFNEEKSSYDEYVDVAHKTYYFIVAGKYRLEINATFGSAKASKTTEFNVYETDPYVTTSTQTITVEWKSYKNLRGIMSLATPFVISDTACQQFIDYVEVIPSAQKDPYIIHLMKSDQDFGESDSEGFYIGSDGGLTTKGRFTFLEEGVYKFNYVFKNAGNPVNKTITVNCEENIDVIPNLQSTISFNESTSVASWNAVEGAAQYKVKIQSKNFFLDSNVKSFDISSFITRQYMDYKLVVIAVRSDGNYIGKMVYQPRIVANGFSETAGGEITLTGAYPSHHTTVALSNNDFSYYGFRGNYGVGTFIEVTFKDNNMPYVMFFADSIDSDITYRGGGKGILVASGMETANVMGTHDELSSMQAFGPNRMNNEWSWGGALLRYANSGNIEGKDLLTQRGRLQALENPEIGSRTYKWVVGTRLNDLDQIVLVQYLYDANDGALLTATESTMTYTWDFSFSNTAPQERRVLTKDDVEPGNIVLYSALKGKDLDTTFKVTSEPGDMPEQLYINAKENEDGTITLKNPGTPANYNVSLAGALTTKLDNSYYALKGDYGVGYFTEILFKGNNLPNVMLFADNINGNVSYNGGNGLFLLSDISRKTTQGIRIFGPNRMNTNTDHTVQRIANTLVTQNGLIAASEAEETKDRTYRYVVGTKANENDELVVIVRLYDANTNELLVSYENVAHQYHDFSLRTADGKTDTSKVDRNMLVSDFNGTNVIVYAAYKENGDDTTIQISEPYYGEKVYEMLELGTTHNEDGSVTLKNANYKNMTKSYFTGTPNSYISYQGEYGVGTEISFKFKGGNVPNVVLFADKINGNMTSDGGKGILIMPGNIQQTSSRAESFRIYGPNRMSGSNVDRDLGLTFTNDASEYNKNFYFLSRFNNKADVEFTYTITTSLNSDKTVNIILTLKENGNLVNTSTFATSLVYEQDVFAGSIIVYAGVNGTYTGKEGSTFTCTPTDTTFFTEGPKIGETPAPELPPENPEEPSVPSGGKNEGTLPDIYPDNE